MKRRGFLTKMLGAVGAAVSLPVLGREERKPLPPPKPPQGRRVVGSVQVYEADFGRVQFTEDSLAEALESAYTNGGDLSDVIYEVSPAETPFCNHHVKKRG